MNPIVRDALRWSFRVLLTSGVLATLPWVFYLPGWLGADRFVAGLWFALAVLVFSTAGVWLRAAALVVLGGRSTPPVGDGGASGCSAADGSLAHLGAPRLRVVR
ncbi:hypothetical protein [Nocardia africana]